MKLNIFVSSTCYDLSQIRSDIKEFIIDLGHNPILSEDYSFPVDTRKNTIENCINAVRENADIFILIIGNRYGSKINDKSITNSEFLTALEKNIPIYTFTLKQMISILPIWKDNPSGNYNSIVDNPQIFNFIHDIRNIHNIWNFEFEKANDIQEVIKSQLSILLKKSLNLSNHLKDLDSFYLDHLSSRALRILIEKSNCYEIEFFLQTLEDEISKHTFLKNDYKYSLKLASQFKVFDFDSFLEFCSIKHTLMLNYIESLSILINEKFKIFFAEPGIASDFKGLYYVSHKCGIIYKEILHWAIDFNSLIVEEDLEELKNAYTFLPINIISELENFPSREKEKLKEAIERTKKGEKNIIIKAKIDLKISQDFDMRHKVAMKNLRIKKRLN